ncbi:MAG: 5-carboxymethyl-2-hydroxymuconate Delta-isomerase [Acidimicrobiia bacterium]
MPHVTLDHSEDLDSVADTRRVFERIHRILVDVAGAGPSNVKSRKLVSTDSFVGSGDPTNAFIHLDVRLMEGRSETTKRDVSTACLAVLVEEYQVESSPRNIQVTVDVTDLDRETYAKHPSGTIPAGYE